MTSLYPDESEKNDSFSNTDDSEDEWNEHRERKCRRSKKIVPKQTLKLKLLEKTRMLRQRSKLGSVSTPPDGCEVKQLNISQTSSIGKKEKSAIGTTEMQLGSNFNESAVITSEDTKPLLDKLIKSSSSTDVENVKCESLVSDNMIKNEGEKVADSRIPKKTKNEYVREPIVIEYSINHSQVLKMNAPGTVFSHSNATTNCNSNFQHQSSPSKTNPFSISSQAVLVKNAISTSNVEHESILTNNASNEHPNVFNASADINHHCERNTSISQLSSNENFHFPLRRPPSNNSLGVTPTNRRRISKSMSSCVSFQRTPNVSSQQISSITRSNSVRIVKNLKINDSKCANKIMENNSKLSVMRNTTPTKDSCLSLKNANSVYHKFGNISPNGTVIHTGTGSVTITPRKVIPEKSPAQRKLFKNEIEGTITCRNIEGTLRYVVNLANGTFIPLSDLQVEKLREQHKGALPIKLKIPVPCDVADKIEPSFIIED